MRRKVKTNTAARISSLPRLLVVRTNKFVYAQIISKDGTILCTANDMKADTWTKKERAFAVGEQIAELASWKWCDKVTFDRNWYLYHGRVAELAAGARKWWLVF